MLRELHRLNALALAFFLVLHLGNHLVLIAGFEAHIAVMNVLRWAYRGQAFELLLLTLFAGQILLGLALLWQRGRPQGAWAWAQAASGIYLALFVLNHVSAAMIARHGALGIDTNVYWAASVISRAPFVWVFAPYYTLAFLALFTHIAAALRFRAWQAPASRFQRGLPVIGLLFGLTVVAALMQGASQGLPPAYEAYLDGFEGD